MRKYELSISADYVPEWGIVEAVRELFQNAIDEETRDSSNKMLFCYDESEKKLVIGNKHSELDIKTLLFGTTTKDKDENMIGNHGEGYKIATTVLLRKEKTVVFYNYCRKEIWRPRLVKSRRYGGALVPTFFVETSAVWEKIPEHSLLIEVSGITPEEYEQIKESNLHLQGNYTKKETMYGEVLQDEKYIGNVYVAGLFICKVPELDIGLDFKPRFVRVERDRSMVNSFDVKWYAARMVEELKDKEQLKKSLDSYSGTYILVERVPAELKNEIAEEFINKNGTKAVPISEQQEMESMRKRGYKPVIVGEKTKEVILDSEMFQDVREENAEIEKREKPLSERFLSFFKEREFDFFGCMEEIKAFGEEIKEMEEEIENLLQS